MKRILFGCFVAAQLSVSAHASAPTLTLMGPDWTTGLVTNPQTTLYWDTLPENVTVTVKASSSPSMANPVVVATGLTGDSFTTTACPDCQSATGTPTIYFQLVATDSSDKSTALSNVVPVKIDVIPTGLTGAGNVMAKYGPIMALVPGQDWTLAMKIINQNSDEGFFKGLVAASNDHVEIQLRNNGTEVWMRPKSGVAAAEGKISVTYTGFSLLAANLQTTAGTTTNFYRNSQIAYYIAPTADATPVFSAFLGGKATNFSRAVYNVQRPGSSSAQELIQANSYVAQTAQFSLSSSAPVMFTIAQTGGKPCPLATDTTLSGPFADAFTTFTPRDRALEFLQYNPSFERICVLKVIDPGADLRYYPSGTKSHTLSSLPYGDAGRLPFYQSFPFYGYAAKAGAITARYSLVELRRDGSYGTEYPVDVNLSTFFPISYSPTVSPAYKKNGLTYLVKSTNLTIGSVTASGSDTQYLATTPSALTAAATDPAFTLRSLTYTVYDTRVSSSDASAVKATINYMVVPFDTFTAVGNALMDGSAVVNVTAGATPSGTYLARLYRISSSTGAVSELTGLSFKTNNCTSASQEQKFGAGTFGGCFELPAPLVAEIVAQRDRLVLRYAIDQQTVPASLISDVSLMSQLSGQLIVSSFEGDFPDPEGHLNAPDFLWKGADSAYVMLSQAGHIARMSWLVTDTNGVTTTTTQNNTAALDMGGLPSGKYLIAAQLCNAIDNCIALDAQTVRLFDVPDAKLASPLHVSAGSGKPYDITVTATKIPTGAVVRIKSGTREQIATQTSVVGQYKATFVAPDGAGTLQTSATIQVSPADFPLAIKSYTGPDIESTTAPIADLVGAKMWYWKGSGDNIGVDNQKQLDHVTWSLTNLANGQITSKAQADTRAFSLSNLDPGEYSLSASIFNQYGDRGEVAPAVFKIIAVPSAQIGQIAQVMTGSKVTITAALYNIDSDTIATFKVGDQTYPAKIVNGVTSIEVQAPATSGSYPISLTIQPDPSIGEAYKTFDGGKLVTLSMAPTKVQLGSLPKFFDIGVPVKLTANAALGFSSAILPNAKIVTEWELYDGSRISGTTMEYTPASDDYKAYAGGARIKFHAWVDGYAGTMTTATINTEVLEPWALPDHALNVKAGGAQVIAPATTVLRLTPAQTISASMLSYRGVRYTWSLPEGDGLIVRAQRDTVSVQMDKPGTYPVQVEIADNKGNKKVVEYVISAVSSSFTFASLSARVTPESGRDPVVVALKVGTSSTHRREHPVKWEVYDNGALLWAGTSAPRPVKVSGVGNHAIEVKAYSNFGNVISKSVEVLVTADQAPVCGAFKKTFGRNADSSKNVRIASNCKDADGKIKAYAWTLNGTALTTGLTAARSFNFDMSESIQVSVTVTDDSGVSTTYSEVIVRPQ